MQEFLGNFHFLRPWLLLLLFLPFMLYGFYFRGINAQSSWQKVIDKRLLDYLLVKGSALKRRIFVWTALAGMLTAIIAAAGPSWQKIEVPALQKQNPVMIILNLSSDMQESDLTPSRLERAKYKIKDFLNLLHGVQAGLEVYSSEPFVIAPLTDDMNILQNLLPAVNFDIMPANGDRLDRAIELAVAKIKAAGYGQGQLVIFTPDVGQKFDLALAAAKKAAAEGFSLNIIGVTALPNEKLTLLAKAGHGKYWNLQADDDNIDMLAQQLNRSNGKLEQSGNLRTIWLDAGWYLLILPLLCCLSFFRKGILVIAFILFSTDAFAGFFLNDNQEGLKAFNDRDYASAAAVFKDSGWKGAAFYRAGDYQKAYAEYQKDSSTEGLYNQGNALAKGGKIKEAIARYEEVLKQNPAHEDAKFNLEYLKKQQQQQQQQQNNKQNKNDNQQQQQEENQQQDKGQSEQNQEQDNQQSQGEQDSEQQQQNQQANPQDNGQQDKNSDNKEEQVDQERQNSSLDQLDENQQNSEGKQNAGALPDTGDKEEQYDEKMQAKAQQYREIPEDPGGLLKAFIYQEYRQNRYGEK